MLLTVHLLAAPAASAVNEAEEVDRFRNELPAPHVRSGFARRPVNPVESSRALRTLMSRTPCPMMDKPPESRDAFMEERNRADGVGAF
jgi:hypothetical protein